MGQSHPQCNSAWYQSQVRSVQSPSRASVDKSRPCAVLNIHVGVLRLIYSLRTCDIIASTNLTSTASSKADTDLTSCSARAVAAPSCCCKNFVPCDCTETGWGSVLRPCGRALAACACMTVCRFAGPKIYGFELTPLSACCAHATTANAVAASSNSVASLARAIAVEPLGTGSSG